MSNQKIEILKHYAKILDLEADESPKDMAGRENQILLMWNLASSRKEQELLKSTIITEMNEPDFSFEKL
jgi:hypothetical protein